MNQKSSHNLIVVILRLMAITFIVSVLYKLPSWLSMVYMFVTHFNEAGVDAYLFVILWPIIVIGTPLLIWKFSSRIADMITHHMKFEKDPVINEKFQWLQLILIGIGVYIIVEAFPLLIAYLFKNYVQYYHDFTHYDNFGTAFVKLLPVILQLVFATFLIFKSGTVARFIKK